MPGDTRLDQRPGTVRRRRFAVQGRRNLAQARVNSSTVNRSGV